MINNIMQIIFFLDNQLKYKTKVFARVLPQYKKNIQIIQL